MDELYKVHNAFKESLDRFRKHDPNLKRLRQSNLVYRSDLLDEKAYLSPGVFLISGGRQVGKTTFCKQLILQQLEKGIITPDSVLFLTGELIDDHHALLRLVSSFSESFEGHQLLIVDEVNYISNWDKAIKFIVDAGYAEQMTIILTGSDSQIIKTSMQRFAGRRGQCDQVDFTFHPLSFSETMKLTRPNLASAIDDISAKAVLDFSSYSEELHRELQSGLEQYLYHGGYLPAINHYHDHKFISEAVFNTYAHWIVGDVLKHNKQEHYLMELLKGIYESGHTQITWNSLSRYLSIEHHQTVSDYAGILEAMHVIHVQQAFQEHKLSGAPKKSRKIYFSDPFITHAVSRMLGFDPVTGDNPLKNTGIHPSSILIENSCVAHAKRHFPTYFIKGNKGEVDLVTVHGQRFLPMEIKWTNQLRAHELKQISTYARGLILTKNIIPSSDDRRCLPVAKYLLHMSSMKTAKVFSDHINEGNFTEHRH